MDDVARDANRVRAVRRHAGFLLGCGAVAGPLFGAVFTAEGARRPGYDPVREPVSALALGRRGRVQQANFVVTGALMLACSAGLRGAAVETTAGRRLVAGAGTGLIGAGVFVTGPVPAANPDEARSARPGVHEVLHNLFSMVVFAALAGACGAYARRFARGGQPGWASYSASSGMLVALGVGLFGRAFAGEQPLDRVGGLIQRVTIAIGWGWLTALAIHLLRRRT